MPATPIHLVFIHGAQNNHTVWLQQKAYFEKQSYSVHCIDLPGHGSNQQTLQTSIEDMAFAVEQELLALGAVDLIIIGHSMGSLVTLALSNSRRLTIKKLVLIGTALPMTVNPSLLELAKTNPSKAIEKMAKWSHAKPERQTDSLHIMQHVLEHNGASVLHNDLNACNQYQQGLLHAKGCRQVTLVIAGQNDMMTPPKSSLVLRKHLSSYEYHELEGVGHAIMSEASPELNARLHSFLS